MTPGEQADTHESWTSARIQSPYLPNHSSIPVLIMACWPVLSLNISQLSFLSFCRKTIISIMGMVFTNIGNPRTRDGAGPSVLEGRSAVLSAFVTVTLRRSTFHFTLLSHLSSSGCLIIRSCNDILVACQIQFIQPPYSVRTHWFL